MDKPDLGLSRLSHFIGSETYYRYGSVLLTEGVKYVMENGYSWFVTDAIVAIRCFRHLRSQPFLSVKLKIDREEGRAFMSIEDGNGNVLYFQCYDWTDARVELTMFYVDGVLMLASEY